MRIGILQLNTKLADPEFNGAALERAYDEAVSRGAELVLSPEMALPGYLPEDRLWEAGLRRRISLENQRLARSVGSVPLVFGTCSPSPSGRLWNELWWCENGKVRNTARKRVLAAYDVFDETRYFEPWREMPELIPFRGELIGLSICEDLWAGNVNDSGPIRYGVNPVEELVESGATLVLNASASPGHLGTWTPPGKSPAWAIPGKLEMRKKLLQTQAARYQVPIAYASRVGAESWLLFDGGSGLVRPDQSWTGAGLFQEEVLIADSCEQGSPWTVEWSESQWLRKALGLGLKENLAKQGLEAVVVGLSGGIDSAVVAAMAAESLGPERVLGAALPTRFTSPESLALAGEQARQLGIHFMTLDADRPFAALEYSLDAVIPCRRFCITDENLQSRCRGTLLMALTSEPAVQTRVGSNRLAVLNTGNKSEASTGYFTLYGDGIGAFGILGDCLKQRVFALAHELGDLVPRGVLERKPTAELAPGQSDEASLLPYKLLDAILGAYVETRRPLECLEADLADVLEGEALIDAKESLPRILRLLKSSEFKRRQLPFALKISPRAFGMGRRMPLTGL